MKYGLNMSYEWNGKRIPLTSGIWGWIFAIAVIAIRALSPNTIPMEQWSIASWVFMTFSITWPWFVWILAKICYVILLGLERIVDRF